jgi:hypothetical protein
MDMLTWEEFNDLNRYKNGRIIDLPLYFYRLTDEQVNMLVGDDWSYYHELKEEMAYELSFYDVEEM